MQTACGLHAQRDKDMAEITDARKGELAYHFLKHKLKEDGFRVDQHFRRRIGNVAKKTGVPFPELLGFATSLIAEILSEVSEPGKAPTPDELDGFEDHGGH